MPMRQRTNASYAELSASGSDLGSEGSEDDIFLYERVSSRPRKALPARNAKGTAKRVPPVKIPLIAKVASLATTVADNPEKEQAEERLAKVDQNILGRIKKALALASHDGTGEDEAKAALRVASKFMQQHNISQADIIAAESEEQKFQRAGQSVVSITSTSGKSVVLADWTNTVAAAVVTFFTCKSYNCTFRNDADQINRIDHTFYGLADQTVAAATSFEMVHNLILTWSAQNKQAIGRKGKNAYCHGVALGLYNLAKNEEKAEAQRTVELEKKRIEIAVKEEAKRRQQELDRLKAPATPAVVEDCKPIKVKLEEVEDEERTSLPTRFSSSAGEQSNMKEDDGSDNEGFGDYGGFGSHPGHADFDDDDDLDDLIDLDAAVPKARVKPDPMEEKLRHEPLRPPSPVRDSSPIVIVKDEDDDVKPEWSSHKQLIQFRNDAEAIADQYLKSQKSKDGKPLKLCNGRKRPGLDLRDRNARDAFYKGKEDAKNIDVKRRRITQTGED